MCSLGHLRAQISVNGSGKDEGDDGGRGGRRGAGEQGSTAGEQGSTWPASRVARRPSRPPGALQCGSNPTDALPNTVLEEN